MIEIHNKDFKKYSKARLEKIKIIESWKSLLESQFSQNYMKQLFDFLDLELKNGKTIFPEWENCFRAFNEIPFNKVKIIILGQDPYHGANQAHGLSFSVPKGVAVPPSLKNIYKELESDIGFVSPNHGNLSSWAKQGVLLLNSVLTVEEGLPASHRGKGWEQFTDFIVEELNKDKKPKVFILWGAYAQKKGKCIDEKKHLVLKSVHPSPLSSYRGFFNSKPFSKANDFLLLNKRAPIKWEISN